MMFLNELLMYICNSSNNEVITHSTIENWKKNKSKKRLLLISMN